MNETRYSFRTIFPDVLVRGRENLVKMEAWHDGALVAPSSGTFTLVDEGGDTISTSAVVVSGSIATATIPAGDLPATLDLSQRLQQRWVLVMPDGVEHTARREAALARFRFYSPIGDIDLESEYPGLGTDVGDSVDSLQPFIDEATAWFVNKLWSKGTWPDLIVEPSATRAPIRERAYYLIFKALYRRTSGQARWETLMNIHRDGYREAFGSMTYKVDADHDGVADSDDRKSAGTVVHRNPAPQRRRSNDPRW